MDHAEQGEYSSQRSLLSAKQLSSSEDSKQQDATLQTSLQMSLEEAHSAAKSVGGEGRLIKGAVEGSGVGGTGAQYGA